MLCDAIFETISIFPFFVSNENQRNTMNTHTLLFIMNLCNRFQCRCVLSHKQNEGVFSFLSTTFTNIYLYTSEINKKMSFILTFQTIWKLEVNERLSNKWSFNEFSTVTPKKKKQNSHYLYNKM